MHSVSDFPVNWNTLSLFFVAEEIGRSGSLECSLELTSDLEVCCPRKLLFRRHCGRFYAISVSRVLPTDKYQLTVAE